MSVTASNLIQGPGYLYRGAFGATEPADSTVGTAPPASSWTDVGATTDGVTLEVEQEFSQLRVDQLDEDVESRRVRHSFMINTNLAEPTLDNLAMILNSTTTAGSGSGYENLSAGLATAGQFSTYSALIVDGPGDSSGNTRRFIGRKMLNTSNVSQAYTKDGMTVFSVSWRGHWVSDVIPSYEIIQEVA